MVLTQLDKMDNIVQLLEFVETTADPSEPDQQKDGQPAREAFFLLEWCPGGSLFELIQNRTMDPASPAGVPEQEVLQIVGDIVQGLVIINS